MEKVIIKCKHCDRILGEAREDFQYLRLGENANLFLQTKISCRCGKFYIWRPKDPPDNRTDEQYEVERNLRNTLGKNTAVRREK